jgi:hypothetical protein
MSAPSPQPQIATPPSAESNSLRDAARLSAIVQAAYILEAVRR